MKTKEWKWKSEDGLNLFARRWMPEEKHKAVVFLVHGLGEHSGRYAHVGKAFSESGFILSGFDLRGHGKSDGQRGHIPSFEHLMSDVHRHLQQLGNSFHELPHFLYGHSLGGLLVLAYATYHQHNLSGIISQAPALRSPVLEQKLKMSLVYVLGELFPTLTIPSGLDAKGISRDPEVVRSYCDDPLVHDRVSLSTGKVGLQAIEWVLSHGKDFHTPLLLLHGMADPVAYPNGSKELDKRISGDTTLKIFAEMYHELHNEPDQADVFQTIMDWMNTRLAKRSGEN